MFEKYEHEILEHYDTFLRFASISADPGHRGACIECSAWVEDYLKRAGFNTEIIQTPTLPSVYAEYNGAGPDKPTVLFYGHYDVQPVDPLDEWDSPPFEPTRKGNDIYARGALDDKGQILYTMAAAATILREEGSLPINVKFIVEGEEEVESRGLHAVLHEIGPKLKADYLVIPDSGIPDRHTPAVTIGCRGIISMTLTFTGSNVDLHSGAAGGIVYNPLHGLVELLAKVRDNQGRITIPGFYDDVRDLTDVERKQLYLEVDATYFKNEIDADMSGGEKAFPPGESGTTRPTLEINGISGGYGGPGFKTVIPAKAIAKVSCRLVPDQRPDDIIEKVTTFFQNNVAEGIKVSVGDAHGGDPFRVSPDSPANKALAQAYTEAFGKECRFITTGGSVPVTPALSKACGALPTLMGTGIMTDQVHAPNEHFGVDRLGLGFNIIRRFIHLIGGSK